jgi:hypothetical protein
MPQVGNPHSPLPSPGFNNYLQSVILNVADQCGSPGSADLLIKSQIFEKLT